MAVYSHNHRGSVRSASLQGRTSLKLCMRPYHGVFVAERRVIKNVLYRVERERGYEHTDNLFSPGYFTVEITPEKSVALVGSTESWDALEPAPDSILEAERQRLQSLLDRVPRSAQTGTAAQLIIAAEQFVIFPGTRPEERVLARASGNEARTIVAGYHWFTDWGRDTMISLEGLTLCTGRHQEAKEILRTFSHYVKDGLLPNHFPEGERTALRSEYNDKPRSADTLHRPPSRGKRDFAHIFTLCKRRTPPKPLPRRRKNRALQHRRCDTLVLPCH